MRPEVRDALNSAQRATLALMPPYADHCLVCHATFVGHNWLIRRKVGDLIVVESLETPGVFAKIETTDTVDVEAYSEAAANMTADLYPGALP